MWHEWTPGVESVQDLVLQNVALVTQKAEAGKWEYQRVTLRVHVPK